jgi:galactose mutarotase-like enzyme
MGRSCPNLYVNVDPDGDQGFPGEVVSYVTYTLSNMTWEFRMVALATTKKTPIMLSSHVSAFYKSIVTVSHKYLN